MWGIFHLCICAWVLQIAYGSNIQFCANDLYNTELGAEEHYLIVYYRDAAGKEVAKRTETVDMSYDRGFRCWGTQLDSFTFTVVNTEFRVEILENDVPGGVGEDDFLGTVYFNSVDLEKDGILNIPVRSGGVLRIRKI